MKIEPLVSVIIPYYNHRSFVKEAIYSVLEQSYSNIELIVIDDGSSDDGFEIIEELNFNNEFSFIRKENTGLTKTLNYGLSLISGDYICVLASDDIWAKDKVAIQIDYLLTHKLKACSGYASTEYEYLNKEDTVDISSSYYCRNDIMLFRCDVPAVNLIFDVSFIKDVGGYNEETKLEDFDMLIKFSQIYGGIHVINKNMAYYRRHDNNISLQRNLIFNERLGLIKSSRFISNEDRGDIFILNDFLISFFRKDLFKVLSYTFTIIKLKLFSEAFKSVIYNLKNKIRIIVKG